MCPLDCRLSEQHLCAKLYKEYSGLWHPGPVACDPTKNPTGKFLCPPLGSSTGFARKRGSRSAQSSHTDSLDPKIRFRKKQCVDVCHVFSFWTLAVLLLKSILWKCMLTGLGFSRSCRLVWRQKSGILNGLWTPRESLKQHFLFKYGPLYYEKVTVMLINQFIHILKIFFPFSGVT